MIEARMIRNGLDQILHAMDIIEQDPAVAKEMADLGAAFISTASYSKSSERELVLRWLNDVENLTPSYSAEDAITEALKQALKEEGKLDGE